MNPKTESASPAEVRKPWLSEFFATAGYVGYIRFAPGTWGSLVGVVIFWFIVRWWNTSRFLFAVLGAHPRLADLFLSNSTLGYLLQFSLPVVFCVVVALLGTLAAHRAAIFAHSRDPQFVVIDEVSGVILTLLLGLAPSYYTSATTQTPDFVGYALLFLMRMLSWKYLLLGFILFRVFDIWKPFPARQAESLPGGWGIMTDDWVAAIYAAIGIWIARAVGL